MTAFWPVAVIQLKTRTAPKRTYGEHGSDARIADRNRLDDEFLVAAPRPQRLDHRRRKRLVPVDPRNGVKGNIEFLVMLGKVMVGLRSTQVI